MKPDVICRRRKRIDKRKIGVDIKSRIRIRRLKYWIRTGKVGVNFIIGIEERQGKNDETGNQNQICFD